MNALLSSPLKTLMSPIIFGRFGRMIARHMKAIYLMKTLKMLHISILIFADIAVLVPAANEKPYLGKLLTAFAVVHSALTIRPKRKFLF